MKEQKHETTRNEVNMRNNCDGDEFKMLQKAKDKNSAYLVQPNQVRL
jgi:hypothetical protein